MSSASNVMREEQLAALLKATSRSFYLTLRALPKPVRSQIGLAYLLARATDTVADTDLVPVTRRLTLLKQLSQRFAGGKNLPPMGELVGHQASNGERALLERLDEALALYDTLSPLDRTLTQSVLETITSGQILDLERFGSATSTHPTALADAADLDDYTYRVAGCVGEFWTEMCLAHLDIREPVNRPQLTENGIRFGKGLQLINILRDIPADLKRGCCYLPLSELTAAGLTPNDLADPNHWPRVQPVYNQWLARAETHLACGWAYTTALPRRWNRVRLACAWPVLIGLETARLLRSGNPLDAAHRIKISRGQVYRLIMRTILALPFPSRFAAIGQIESV